MAKGQNDGQKAEQALLEWYDRLYARYVDLVGDYAGSELFIIEGDSLLRCCFSQPELDFKDGFQLLHAVHIVESLLHGLRERKCIFNVVFIEQNASHSIPAHVAAEDEYKYVLARAVVVRHLQAHVSQSHSQVQIKVYPSLDGEDFSQHLINSGAYFVMCHDGAAAANPASDDSSTKANMTKSAMRSVIAFFMQKGFNVALINGLHFQDTKVWTMVLENSKRSIQPNKAVSLLHGQTSEMSKKLSALDVSDPQISDMEAIPSEANRLLVASLHNLLSNHLVSPDFAHAVLLHAALKTHLPLSARASAESKAMSKDQQGSLEQLCLIATHILCHQDWTASSEHTNSTCDVSDLIDGQILMSTIARLRDGIQPSDVGSSVSATYSGLCVALEIPRWNPQQGSPRTLPTIATSKAPSGADHNVTPEVKLLPFSNEVFDPHLASVRIAVDERAGGAIDETTNRIFKELSHWHNTKPVQAKAPVAPPDPKQQNRALRRNQFFMKDLTTYAASLTNATGRTLEPETIITKKDTSSAKSNAQQAKAENEQAKPNKGSGSKKTDKKAVGKQKIMQAVEENRVKKETKQEEKHFTAWKTQLRILQLEDNLALRYEKANRFLQNLTPELRQNIGAEVELYMLDTLLRVWQRLCKSNDQGSNMHVAALLWSRVQSILRRPDLLNTTMISHVAMTCKTLGFPMPAIEPTIPDHKLSFELFTKVDSTMVATKDPKEFQLEHCGPYMERSIDSSPDARTGGRFDPDRWQRDVLDAIDAQKSLFVVAPTSAGKTFISFYAMKKVLEADDNGVIIYVAPTKALVNQIAAEIQGNFQKSYTFGGKSVWAMHTRDYRINNPTGCQVLVTVPHILQIMLLSPANAGSWSRRVKRIIFDEIHSIGQAEDGIVWEQLLLLAPCPIIALSATVGNPEEFSDWLSSTQESLNNELAVVHHPHRYSDLRKYHYNAPLRFSPKELPTVKAFAELGLDKDEASFAVMHPVSALVNRSRGIPADFGMEPRECLDLWRAFEKFENGAHTVDPHLAPSEFFGNVIRKRDLHQWERSLTDLLRTWMSDSSSPFDQVFEQLSRSTHRSLSKVGNGETGPQEGKTIDADDIYDTALPLLVSLHTRGALPAILFNYDRSSCEKMGNIVLEQLKAAEQAFKNNDPAWKRKLARFEEWKEAKASRVKKPKANTKINDPEDRTSKDERARDAAESEIDPMASFNPEAPLESYSFANTKVIAVSEFEEMVRQMKRRYVPQWLCDGLERGVGIHHAGMNRSYRQAVEILFRRGYLRVVIATGTLALGINMPCKTVVFSGDSVFLTALNYRQAAGRAGRRGFDLLGNVVFQALPQEKACRLVSSRLPSLNGHFPVTTSLVLRLFILLHESKNSPYARTAINTLLSQPRLYLGGQSFKDQVLHHIRFSIEYLRRSRLLDRDGAPLNFAGAVSHLYFTENSSFALHALLKGGYFHRLTSNMNEKNEENIMRTMMLVLSHLFGRRPCRQADLEPENYEKRIKSSPSLVLLSRLPDNAHEILRQHNRETLSIFSTYVKTFAEQHLAGQADNKLPFTGLKCGGDTPFEGHKSLVDARPPPTVRSQFVALSGHSDDFDTIQSLCRTARSGVFLEESVIPHVPLYPDESSIPLNAYLLDFYKHGDTTALEKANGIRKGDMWFLLNDFSLILATIVTSLKNILKISEDADADMIDLQGGGDAGEESAMIDQMDMSDLVPPPTGKTDAADQPSAPIRKTKKAPVADSWDDDESDEDTATTEEPSRRTSVSEDVPSSRTSTVGDSTTAGGSDQDLRKVLKAFDRLKVTFDEKFRAMWA